MKCGMNGVRAIAAALLMAALLATIGGAAAQDAVSDPGGGVTVSVACAFDEVSGLTACDFTPIDAAGGSVLGIAIPTETFCAPVAGDPLDGGYYTALPDGYGSASLSFVGAVSVGGEATYSVDTSAGTVAAPGGGIVCDGGAPVIDNIVIDDTVVEEPIVEETTYDEVVAEEIPTDTSTTEEESTGEIDVVEDVTVTIYAYDCLTDPNGVDPAEYSDCTPSAGIELSATADEADAGTQSTDVNGWAAFTVPSGSAFVVAENLSTLPSGYEPYGNGVAFLTAEAESVVVFIHLTEPLVGRLQIVNGSCPTSGDTRTEFRVIEPRSVAMADAPECAATGGTIFTILGGSLPEGGISVITDGDGAWRGYLPAGTYTVVDDSTASAEVTVIVDDISVVVVIDYISHPLGVLNVSRFLCVDAEEAGIVITFFGDEPTVGDDDGCSPVDGTITIDVQAEVFAASVITFDLGDDGVEEIELEPGNYVLSDDLTGETAEFTIEGGTRLYAVVQDLVVSDDGIGNPGGEGPGEDPDGNPAPGPGDGTGGTPTDGSGNPTSGDPDDDGTDGGVDAGENSNYDDELANVSQLPATGSDGGAGDQTQLMLALLALAGALGFGAVAMRSLKRTA